VVNKGTKIEIPFQNTCGWWAAITEAKWNNVRSAPY